MDRIERQPFEALGLDDGDESEQGLGRHDGRRGRRKAIELKTQAAVLPGAVLGRIGGVMRRQGVRRLRHVEMRHELAGGEQQRQRQQGTRQVPDSTVSGDDAHGGRETTERQSDPQPARDFRGYWRGLPAIYTGALKLTLDSLRSHLSGEPQRAYLVSGDEALLVGEAADAIRARVKRAGFEREVHFIERVADWEEVRASANNLSLFGSRKLIELRLPSGKPGVGGANAITALLQDPSPDNVFLMITGKLEREQSNSAWVKAFESAGAWLPVWPVEVARLPQWLRSRAAEMGIEIDDEALRFIVERTEGNLLAAHQELEKLELSAGKRIDLASARASTADSARFDVFQLGEAALGGDVPRALRILAGLRSEGVEATLALWALSREIHSAWGTTQQGSGAARTWQRPSAALENARRRASRLPFARLAARVSRADRMIKGQHRGDAWDEMALLIIEFAGRRSLPIVGQTGAGQTSFGQTTGVSAA
jgi:DNA polymerase-3 subunit delta